MYTAIAKRQLHSKPSSIPTRAACVFYSHRQAARHFSQGIPARLRNGSEKDESNATGQQLTHAGSRRYVVAKARAEKHKPLQPEPRNGKARKILEQKEKRASRRLEQENGVNRGKQDGGGKEDSKIAVVQPSFTIRRTKPKNRMEEQAEEKGAMRADAPFRLRYHEVEAPNLVIRNVYPPLEQPKELHIRPVVADVAQKRSTSAPGFEVIKRARPLIRKVEAKSPLDMGLVDMLSPHASLADHQLQNNGNDKDKVSTTSALDDLSHLVSMPSTTPLTYQTTLPDSQIYHGTISSLTPSILRSQAIEPAIPFLIRSPTTSPTTTSSSASLTALATSTALPAISKWFHPTPSSLSPFQPYDYTPFSSHLTNSSKDIHLPYELLTPILPSTNNGRHDILSSFLFPSNASLRPSLPPPGSLELVLQQCLAHLATTTTSPIHPSLPTTWADIFSNSVLRKEFTTLREGVPMSNLQWSTLQRYGTLFQAFHSFTAPLSLLIAASSPVEDSDSTAPSLPGLYIAQAQLADLPTEMQADLPLPGVLANLYASEASPPSPASDRQTSKVSHEIASKYAAGPNNKRKRATADIYSTSLWLGTAPTFTPLHKDPNPNLFIQLRGQKVVKLLSPLAGQGLFARVQRRIAGDGGAVGVVSAGGIRGEEMMHGVEKREMERGVWGDGEGKEGEEGGSKGEGEGDMVLLNPGDAVYIPKGWWHSVRSVGEGVNGSVNWWFR